MAHVHTMRLVSDLALGLPTTDGLQEKAMLFACPCGRWQSITGEFRIGCRHPLAALLDHASAEAQQPGLWGRIIRANEAALRRNPR